MTRARRSAGVALEPRSWVGCALASALVASLAGCRPEGGLDRPEAPSGETPRDPSLGAEGPRTGQAPAPVPASCHACGAMQSAGRLEREDLDETSGVTASAVHPGVLYVHNDSGDAARFYAIDVHGRDLGAYEVRGARAVDWEDVARGPCAAGSCLYLGDIGDNLRARGHYVVYRVPEPADVRAGTHEVEGEAIGFHYPDGVFDAETLLADPRTGRLFVITKIEGGPSGVYRFPADAGPGPELTLERVGAVSPPGGDRHITGGDIHPSGRQVLLRSYEHVWRYAWPEGSALEVALSGTPCEVPSLSEPQGEAVGWLPDGGYVSISEGVGATIGVVACDD